jgi:anti-sigma regulatory factor (Ser/Thr protein kinase)
MVTEPISSPCPPPAHLAATVPLMRGQNLVTMHPLLRGCIEELMGTLERMWSHQTVQRAIFSREDRVLHVYAVPAPHDAGVLLVFDVTHVSQLLRRLHETVAHVYRDMFHASTDGRCRVVEPEEIPDLLGAAVAQVIISLRRPEDIGRCRDAVGAQMRAAGWDPKKILAYTLAVSEAATNAIKHGDGGAFQLFRYPDRWVGLVVDGGGGIDLALLPSSTLVRGFSTKRSLGLGFSAMLRCTDRLTIASSNAGLMLLLESHDPNASQRAGGFS